MKAVGLYKHLPIEDPQSLVDLDIPQPKHPTGHDLLVSIKAISVNPLYIKDSYLYAHASVMHDAYI
jgi:NADPH2:quinone reductase